MILDDYVEPSALTAFVREVPTPAGLFLNRYLPDRLVPDSEAAIEQLTRTNRAAKFRAWDTETPTGVRDTFRRAKVKLPPLGIKTPINEYEQLMLERIRSGGDNRDGYIRAIYDDAEINTRSVLNRMELARGDALVDGKVTIAENGLSVEADFGLPGGNVVAAATVWTDHDDAAPVQELKAWLEYYTDLNGEKPGFMIGSSVILNNLLLSDEVRNLFARGGDVLSGGPGIITQAQMQAVLQAYGFPPFVEYNTRIEVDGVNTRVIAQDKLIFVPADPNALGYTAWGATAEALALASSTNPQLAFQQLPGLVGVVLREGDPPRVWTKVGATGMPIITDPNRLMVADVL